jgi:cytoskeletal protein CcmA (bactofilin family)
MNAVSLRSIVAVVLALAGSTLGAQAQTTETSARGNVYAAGGTVRPSSPVEGDFVGFGGRVTIDQAVKGDATVAGGSVDLRAPVGDDVRAAGGDVNVESTVGGELLAVGGNVTLAKSAQIEQGAMLAGGSITIDGKISGPLKVTAQTIVLNGEVTGDARLAAEKIELGPTARIGGALHYAAGELKKADGAVVSGAIVRDERAADQRERRAERERQWHRRISGPSWVGTAFGFLGLLAAGTVFLLLFPRFSAQAPELIRSSPWLSMAIGFGVLVGVPVLAVLLLITLLGIPLGIAAFALYPGLLLMGYLTGALFLAQRARIAVWRDKPETFGITVGFVALALLALMLIGRLPVVGSLTAFVITIAGMGACVLEWHRRRQPPPPATPAAPA